MVTAIDLRTKVLFICNPNNPTGTHLTTDELEYLLQCVDGRAIVVLDEAYAEYMEASDFPDSRVLLERHPNLVVFRTFSKAWALAGLRIGYLVGGRDLVDAVRRTAIAYSINVIAQEAAMAALQDNGVHLRATREMVHSSRSLVSIAMQNLNVPTISHNGNFMMLKLPMGDTGAHRQLMRRGYMVRAMSDFRFPGWVRLSLSTPSVMGGFIGALSEILPRLSRVSEPS